MSAIGVIGCGAWATTAAKILAENGHSVTLWCHRDEYVATINHTHQNTLSLPGIPLPSTIQATLNAHAFHDLDEWVICLPSKFLDTLGPFKEVYAGQPIISLIKGLPTDRRWTFISNYLSFHFNTNSIAVLSGPNLAMELAHRQPAAAVIAATDAAMSRQFQQRFSTPYFRTYTASDHRGVELGGVLKNVYAMAAGIADGLKLGTNAKSALMTRSLTEMVKIGAHFGAVPTTFYGLSGIGDLMTTAYSDSSRNWQAGYHLATDTNTLTRGVAEGARTAVLLSDQVPDLASIAPIFWGIVGIVKEGISPQSVIASLMDRELKSE
jgi:glycerol-3-phosphate dehydrogenase (NAD(P)+)